MTWTTEKPTTPGWYWWRNLSTDGHAHLVEVTIDGDGVLRIGPPASSIEGGRLGDTTGVWTERVEMPR